MVAGGKKDAYYIATLFKKNIELLFKGRETVLDLLKETTDVFSLMEPRMCRKRVDVWRHIILALTFCMEWSTSLLSFSNFVKDLASHPIVKVRGGCNVFFAQLLITFLSLSNK